MKRKTLFTSYLPFFGFAILSSSACTSEKKESSPSLNLVLEVMDSIQIDFLGEMRLLDYDSKRDQYFLVSDLSQHYLEIDNQGKILHDVTLREDGIDAISMALGYSYLDGKAVVLTPDKGYVKFDAGKKVEETKIPYPFAAFMFYPKLNFFERGERVMYPYLWPESKEMAFEDGDFYLSNYKMPIMQILDLANQDTVGTMYLPETSPLKDGKVHGFPVPIVTQRGSDWLLSMWLEPRFYVFEEEGEKLIYKKTIELEVPDWVGYKPVEADQAGTFFNEIQKIRSATLEDLLVMDDYILAIYRKGIPEEKLSSVDARSPEGKVEIEKINPYYAAVFDKDYKLIQADLALPPGIHGPTVVNKYGELVTSKNPSLSEVEGEGLVLYRMKLVKKEGE